MKRLAVMAVLGVLLLTPAIATAACDLDGPGRCYPEFRELLSVTGDGTRRLVAVGRLRSPEAPGRDTAIVEIEPAGKPIVVDPPSNVADLDGRSLSYVEGREIVRSKFRHPADRPEMYTG